MHHTAVCMETCLTSEFSKITDVIVDWHAKGKQEQLVLFKYTHYIILSRYTSNCCIYEEVHTRLSSLSRRQCIVTSVENEDINSRVNKNTRFITLCTKCAVFFFLIEKILNWRSNIKKNSNIVVKVVLTRIR